jgi:lipopolysaccharide/colanic/teichoic acid biosynthesis glycosyltransferase
LGWLTPRQAFRWRVSSGPTGLAQLLRPPCAEGALDLDRYYVSNGSLLLDIRLIALSFVVNGLGKRRVRHHLPRLNS